ncbi:MAG: adenylosuccinate synthetase, partial [Methanomassiliicoccales archaeon]
EIDGERVENFPASLSRLQRAKPIYQDMEGWDEWGPGDAADYAKKGYDSLPENMRAYLEFISKNVGVPIRIISLGKERNETIDLRCRKTTRHASFY